MCTAANTAHVQAVRARALARSTEHGRALTYDAGCRCADCLKFRQLRYEAEEGRREHWWRALVTGTYRDARDAWEALRESDHPAWGATGGDYGTVCYQLDDAEFRRLFPPPTLRGTLVGLSRSV